MAAQIRSKHQPADSGKEQSRSLQCDARGRQYLDGIGFLRAPSLYCRPASQRQTDDQKENLNEKGADIEHEERRYRQRNRERAENASRNRWG